MTRLGLKLGDETRSVSHYWYNTWPDHGVPLVNGKAYPNDIMVLSNDSQEKNEKKKERKGMKTKKK